MLKRRFDDKGLEGINPTSRHGYALLGAASDLHLPASVKPAFAKVFERPCSSRMMTEGPMRKSDPWARGRQVHSLLRNSP